MLTILPDESDIDNGSDYSILLGKVTHNESGDILLVISHGSVSLSDTGTMTIEGTTNSPTDYDIVSWYDVTNGNLTDSSKYYSTIDYITNIDNFICARFNVGVYTSS